MFLSCYDTHKADGCKMGTYGYAMGTPITNTLMLIDKDDFRTACIKDTE